MSYYQGFFKKNGLFNVKYHFVYTMKTQKYERTISLNAHNVTQYGVKEIIP